MATSTPRVTISGTIDGKLLTIEQQKKVDQIKLGMMNRGQVKFWERDMKRGQKIIDRANKHLGKHDSKLLEKKVAFLTELGAKLIDEDTVEAIVPEKVQTTDAEKQPAAA